jgi:hypothetical protein
MQYVDISYLLAFGKKMSAGKKQHTYMMDNALGYYLLMTKLKQILRTIKVINQTIYSYQLNRILINPLKENVFSYLLYK